MCRSHRTHDLGKGRAEAMIHQGDVRDVLPTLDAGSVQCVITSPPYWGLRDYGVKGQIGLEPTPEEYVQTMVEVFREVRRVLRDDGTLWLNLGDSFHDKQLTGIPWRVAFALQADGWYLRSDIIWAKGVSFCPDYAGSVMPESVTDRPTKSHEYLFLLTKSPRYYYDADAVREDLVDPTRKHEPSTDYASMSVRHDGARGGYLRPPSGKRNLRSVWTISPKPYSEAHFATFPTALVEPCVNAGSKKGDTVLDPFAGSGTTGLVAGKLGREFVGIELNADYIKLANDRIEGPLFAWDSQAGGPT
jgi:DNA modification methylase